MSVKIALAQMRSKAGDIDENLVKLSEFACFASKRSAKLVVTPELFLTGYNVKPLIKLRELAIMIPENYQYTAQKHCVLDKIASICMDHGIALLIGLPEIQRIGDDKVYYNTAIWMNSTGKIVSIYRKYHLWGKAEKAIFSEYPNDNGEQYKLIESPFGMGLKFGILICFDIEFVEPARILALKGCDCILVPTALPLNEGAILGSMIPSRASENGLFVAYCNFPKPFFAGGTCLVAPNGKKMANAGFEDENLALATINVSKYDDVRKRNNYLGDRRVKLFDGLQSAKL